MPNNVVKTKDDEHKWKKAEEITIKKFGTLDNNFDYVMGIYKKMKQQKTFKEDVNMDFKNKVKRYIIERDVKKDIDGFKEVKTNLQSALIKLESESDAKLKIDPVKKLVLSSLTKLKILSPRIL